ncbi:MAG: D-xylose ABC transporter ATP-binding protein [Mesoaciditoga sp.]|uniref:sugar ABC transporter ATP-binding protein n=1 Tax=Athalassotoga sp. TaxID=2022597 RepID=UPI000CC4D85D|nr:MAG: D-xylose ABC transporter ATP-binding protein [Mesoaciditoga sp.]HEU24241.1 sugar ABC transporter ATP-binding protein [Mesoaciditoga lauensis]
MEILRVENIKKSFSGVSVLKNINLSIKSGELHAIVGENGAGKSTLMKIIAGELEPDSGKIYLNGKEVQFHSPLDAINSGIALIHQEFSLVPQLTVYENIFLGREISKSFLGIDFIDRKAMKKEAQNVLKTFGIENIPVNSKIKDLSVANKQLTEIAKALSTNSKILIMDEPTAALTLRETEKLFSILTNLKSNGVTIIFISHRLEEIFQIADSVTILRNGELIATKQINEVSMEEIVSMMIGKSMSNRFPPKPSKKIGDKFFEVRNISSDAFKGINFSLRRGEILGIAGLVGCGNTQVGESIYGLRKFDGEIYFEGKKINISKPTDAIENGIFLVPEDRHDLGLVLQLSVKENHSLPNLDLFSKLGFVSTSTEKKSVKDTIAYLNTKVSSINQIVENLSGGNQQKVVLGKWLVRSPKVLILDEPTRGIDVGAKFEIYKFIYEQSSKGVGIILISSELAEVLNLSDRILVMSEGRITGELDPQNATQEDILRLAVKGKES